MSGTAWFMSYKLVEGASVAEYLLLSEKVNTEILSKQKGFISWQVLVDGDTWVDLILWETPEDAKNAETAGENNPVSQKYYSFIDFKTLKNQIYSVEKNYGSTMDRDQ